MAQDEEPHSICSDVNNSGVQHAARLLNTQWAWLEQRQGRGLQRFCETRFVSNDIEHRLPGVLPALLVQCLRSNAAISSEGAPKPAGLSVRRKGRALRTRAGITGARVYVLTRSSSLVPSVAAALLGEPWRMRMSLAGSRIVLHVGY